MKDQLIRAGIGLLNQDLFKKQNYMQFDALMLRLARKEQWVEILKEFVTDQLAPEAENLTDEELKTACYVEQLLKKYEPLGTAGVLAKERKRRKKQRCRRRLPKKENRRKITRSSKKMHGKNHSRDF